MTFVGRTPPLPPAQPPFRVRTHSLELPARKTTSTAPSAEQFCQVWKAAQDGSLSRGLPDVGSVKKLRKMEWCLGEGIKKLDWQFLERSNTMCLHRDATDGTLLCRFQASDVQLNRRCGILGIRKSYGSSANDITAATADIYKQAATERLGAYRRSHRDKEIKPKALSFI